MSEVRCADGETLCQARQQPGQCVLELQQILGDGLHRQPKHHNKEITPRLSKNVNNVKNVNYVKNVNNEKNANNAKNTQKQQQ